MNSRSRNGFQAQICLTLSVLALLTNACTRSDAYRRDQDAYEDRDNSYYNKSTTTDTAAGGRLDRIKQPKKKILVLGFWNDTPVGDDSLGAFSAEELRRELYLGKRVLFPDDKTVTAVTKDFVEGDHVQVSQLVREGRRLGVSSVVVGRISKITFRQNREEVGILREAKSAVAVDIEMKVFDVSSGREVLSAKRSGSAMNTSRIIFDTDALGNKDARNDLAREALHDAAVKLVPDVLMSLEKMDWQGRIAKIIGNKVYINAGRASGLLAGDILKVLSPGEEITDPVTKAYLGRSEGLLKGTLEVSEFIGEDSAMTMIHTGGNFQDGDVVRLY
jgi:hypothetical protein